MPVSILIVDLNGKINYFNKAYSKIEKSVPFDLYYILNDYTNLSQINNCLLTHETYVFNKISYSYSIQKVPIYNNDLVTGFMITINSIANPIESSNKTTNHLKDIHHYIRNNLQVLLGLVVLKGKHICTVSKVNRSCNISDYIRVISGVYEYIEVINDIAYCEYDKNLYKLIDSFLIKRGIELFNPATIEYSIEVDKLLLSTETSVYLNIIIYELISNSLMHGFVSDNQEKPQICIKVVQEEGIIVIEYSDNGLGLSKEIDFESLDISGLKLIYEFVVAQNKGRLIINSKDGFNCRIEYMS